jgi:biotin carboxyl carrier protein
MYEININDQNYKIEVISRDGNNVRIAIDDRVYDVDITEPENGIFNMLYNGKSVEYNFYALEEDKKKYKVFSGHQDWEVEIIDPQRRYRKSRHSGEGDEEKFISTPMPGKVVKILVKEGDEVPAGTTVIIISAMKMESEYKVAVDRKIKEVLVKEGDNIDGNQPLITFE